MVDDGDSMPKLTYPRCYHLHYDRLLLANDSLNIHTIQLCRKRPVFSIHFDKLEI